jgi:tetratricopeptide (TPR) repeat protein
VLLGFHLADELLRAARSRAPGRFAGAGRLALVGVVAFAACFANPFGWGAVWQPFDYFVNLRHETHFKGIGELQPLGWLNNQTNGVFAMLALWPLLMLWRFRRRGFDLAELLACGFFTAWMASSQRFFGPYAIAAAVYLARDLDDWVATRRWPAWTAPPWPRAALAAAAIVAVGAAEWSRPDRPLAIAIDMKRFPVHATDFMAAQGVRGRGFTQTAMGGWQIWRFWPERERLPFMDIHQTGTPEDRELYTHAFLHGDGWKRLDRGERFDYVLLDPYLSDTLLDALDAEPDMALAFLDDAGVLYVRASRLPDVANTLGYRWLGGGTRRNAAVFARAREDSFARAGVVAELERLRASSPWNARASSLLATLALEEQRLADAKALLEHALTVDPRTPLAHSRLAGIALFEARPADAVRHFERERALFGPQPGIELGLGLARRSLGDEAAARRHFAAEIARYPSSPSGRAAQEAAAASGGR